MARFPTRRQFLGGVASTLLWPLAPLLAQEGRRGKARRPDKSERPRKEREGDRLPAALAPFDPLSLVLGCVTDRSATVSALAQEARQGYFEFGVSSGNASWGKEVRRTKPLTLPAGSPVQIAFEDLQPNCQYIYRWLDRPAGEAAPANREGRFHTQRPAGSTFCFALQGDSHPERAQMHDPELYARTLRAAAGDRPDFYLCLGDDFSVDTLHTVTAETVAERYALQHPFLGLVGQSASVFLVNGNHEQTSQFNFNQTDLRHSVAVWGQQARSRYYSLPIPAGFFSGDTTRLESLGPLGDYYAWTWGDALFVVLDFYWHSPGLVDNGFEGGRPSNGASGKKAQEGRRQRDGWDVTLGDAQYRWFQRTLAESRAKFKFVFAHHVLGTNRGGIEECDLFEWGGRNKRGEWEFPRKRPGWELPIHPLMVQHGVTIFFQGHDHLFVRQERDGIIYQEVPNPADPGYVAYNEQRYQSGTKLPNSGYLRVTVSPDEANVEYVRCYLPKDETNQRRSGEVAYRYSIPVRGRHA